MTRAISSPFLAKSTRLWAGGKSSFPTLPSSNFKPYHDLTTCSLGRIGTRTGIFPWNYVEVLESTLNPIPPSSALYTEDGDETGYRPDGPDSFGLPPDNNDDLYSANDEPTPSASVYPPPPSPLPRTDVINYGAEFEEYDDTLGLNHATDLHAALSGMGFGIFGNVGDGDGEGLGEVLRPRPPGGEVVGRSGRRKVVTLETIEE